MQKIIINDNNDAVNEESDSEDEVCGMTGMAVPEIMLKFHFYFSTMVLLGVLGKQEEISSQSKCVKCLFTRLKIKE